MHILELLYETDETLDEDVKPRITRQLRRYGNKTKLQFRCNFGDKKGRLVSNPAKCGIKKNPKKVLVGKKSSRIKKLQRIRKSQFTKRKPLTKRLVSYNTRLNKLK